MIIYVLFVSFNANVKAVRLSDHLEFDVMEIKISRIFWLDRVEVIYNVLSMILRNLRNFSHLAGIKIRAKIEFLLGIFRIGHCCCSEVEI